MAMANDKISHLSLQQRADLIKGAMLAAGTEGQDAKEAAVLQELGDSVYVHFYDAFPKNNTEMPMVMRIALTGMKRTFFSDGKIHLSIEEKAQSMGLALPLYFMNHVISPAMDLLSSRSLDETGLGNVIAMQRSMRFSMAQRFGKDQIIKYAQSRQTGPWSYDTVLKKYPALSSSVSKLLSMSALNEVASVIRAIDFNNMRDVNDPLDEAVQNLVLLCFGKWHTLLCATLLAAQNYSPPKLTLGEVIKDMSEVEREMFLSTLSEDDIPNEKRLAIVKQLLVDPNPPILDAALLTSLQQKGWLGRELYQQAINKIVATDYSEVSQLPQDLLSLYTKTVEGLQVQWGGKSKQALYREIRDNPSLRGLTALSRVAKAVPALMGTVFTDADTQKHVVGTIPPIDLVENFFFGDDGGLQSKAMVQIAPTYAMCSSLQALYVVIKDAERAFSDDDTLVSRDELSYIQSLRERIDNVQLVDKVPENPSIPQGLSIEGLSELIQDKEITRYLTIYETGNSPNQFESLTEPQVSGRGSLAVRCRVGAEKIQKAFDDDSNADMVILPRGALSRKEAEELLQYLVKKADYIEYKHSQAIKEANQSLAERLDAYRAKQQEKEEQSKTALQSTDGVVAWNNTLASFAVSEPAGEGVGLVQLEATKEKLEELKRAKATRLERKSKGWWHRTRSQDSELHRQSTEAKGAIQSFALTDKDAEVLQSLGDDEKVASLVAGKNIRDLKALVSEQDILDKAIKAIESKIETIHKAQGEHTKRQELDNELARFNPRDAFGVLNAYQDAVDLLRLDKWDSVDGKEQLLEKLKAASDEAAKGQVGVLASAFDGVDGDPNPIARCDQLIQAIAKFRPLVDETEKTQLKDLAVKVHKEKCGRLLDAIQIPDEKPVVDPLLGDTQALIGRLNHLKNAKEQLSNGSHVKSVREDLESNVILFQLTKREREMLSSFAGEGSEAVLGVIEGKGVGARQRGWFRRQSSSDDLLADVAILTSAIESLEVKVSEYDHAKAEADKAGKAHQALTEGLAAAREQMKESPHVSGVMECYEQSIKLLKEYGVDEAHLGLLRDSLRNLRQASAGMPRDARLPTIAVNHLRNRNNWNLTP